MGTWCGELKSTGCAFKFIFMNFLVVYVPVAYPDKGLVAIVIDTVEVISSSVLSDSMQVDIKLSLQRSIFITCSGLLCRSFHVRQFVVLSTILSTDF